MSVNAEVKIPDLWFDVYARLLPGAAFVAVIRVVLLGNSEVPNATELFVLAFAGYLFALISQPISSRLAKIVEHYADKAAKEYNGYVAYVQGRLKRNSREAMILSKMHGEVTFFCQMAVLSSVFQIIQVFYANTKTPWAPWVLIIPFLFVALAFEVAERRVGKAKKYDSNSNTDS